MKTSDGGYTHRAIIKCTYVQVRGTTTAHLPTATIIPSCAMLQAVAAANHPPSPTVSLSLCVLSSSPMLSFLPDFHHTHAQTAIPSPCARATVTSTSTNRASSATASAPTLRYATGAGTRRALPRSVCCTPPTLVCSFTHPRAVSRSETSPATVGDRTLELGEAIGGLLLSRRLSTYDDVDCEAVMSPVSKQSCFT